ncbi:MAG: metallophosphoesterase [Gammaproteobacteria bacterium]
MSETSGKSETRIFALSDIHVDFDANARWVAGLSRSDYRRDILILAGDVSDSLERMEACFTALAGCFRQVYFVPGNHDLWVGRDSAPMTSLDKFVAVNALAHACGVSTSAGLIEDVAIVPLLGWYDYSFGVPDPQLADLWMDFRACRWPEGWYERQITEHFIGSNVLPALGPARLTISFSHFLPRIDVMPDFIPAVHRKIYPLLGTDRLDRLVRSLGADIHVYGHSHINRDVCIDGVRYINNAFAYPHEERIAAKALRCIARIG